ncbi:hypothetical protein Tco_1557056 [Tanacetum coccineum]
MDIVAERAARKAAKSKVQSSLKPSPVAGDDGLIHLLQMILLSQFAPKKKKQIFATDFAEKLVRSTRVDFIFKVNFLMLFANVMGKVDTMRAFVNLSVVRRIHEDTNIVGVDWCDFIHRCLAISLKLNTDSGFYNGPLCFLIDLKIYDEAFGKLEFYGEWSENETVEAGGFCEYASVLPHTRQRSYFEHKNGFSKETVLLEEAKAQKAPQNIKPKPAAVNTKEAVEKLKPAENVKELAEKPKEPVEKAQKAPQNVKPKPVAVKTKEAAKKPKLAVENVKELAEKPKEPAENVKELTEKPKEPAEKAHKAPHNVKPKPAAVKTKEAAEKPKPAENVKELAEKPKEPAEKAQKAPQNVNPKLAAVKTKEEVEKPKLVAENVKDLAEKPKEPAGDDYQVVRAATVMKVEDCEEFEDSYPCLASLFDPVNKREGIHDQDVYRCETVFQSLGGYHELSSVRVNMETLAPTLLIDANVIDCWVALLNFEELALGYPTPTNEEGDGSGSDEESDEEEDEKDGDEYLKEQNHSSHEAVAKMRPFIPKLKLRTLNNHVDCGVFSIIHMENYVGDVAKNWEFGLCEESDEHLSMNLRDPPKQAKETDASNVVVGVNEVVDQVKEKGRRKK